MTFSDTCLLIGSEEVLQQLMTRKEENHYRYCGLIHRHERAGASQIEAQNCRPSKIDEQVT